MGGKERKDAAIYVCNVRLQAMLLAQSRVAIVQVLVWVPAVY